MNANDDCLRAVAAALTKTVGRAGDLCARFGGAVGGIKALARWSHPERGMIAPARFI